ncbi:hypothetical protein Rhopal_007499-T1 [Rhodotorula paludigena]|uniref:Right handed beta helix domain-containing protein n=1 Tax=Rhodotorula paludigena TaxID=86838 RepID=A0AAV5GV64_9BASI|nr:hypothetical protein Rhopal_007499-T1 [Rhodotorula paludigena]
MRFLQCILALSLAYAVAADGLDHQYERRHEHPTRTVNKRAAALLPYNVASPASTPAFVHPPDPVLLTVQQVATLLTVTTAPLTSVLAKTALQLVNSAATLNIDGVLKQVTGLVSGLLCGLLPCPKANGSATDPRPPLIGMGAKTCLDSKYNATVINSLFYYGGADTTVYLCPGSEISLEGPVFFYAKNQTLTTLGEPRAKLTIKDKDTTCALYIADAGNDDSTVSNLIIDGSRPSLGYKSNGLALIEMGGNNQGQKIMNVKAYEPRGWSSLHIIEGYENQCSGTTVSGNQIGPAGHAPSGAQQFSRLKKRDSTGTYPPGQWADGISVACKNSVVTGNTITDATDGAIVIFGAPGTKVSNNEIITDDRSLLGGINAVDYNPYSGNFAGVVVDSNTITAKGTLLKVGIAVGVATWYAGVNNNIRTNGGSFTNNKFTTGPQGYFGYGVSVAGHNGATVTGSSFSNVNFGGVYSSSCFKGMPAMQPLVYNSMRDTGNTLQTGFLDANYQLAICIGPGAINSTVSV